MGHKNLTNIDRRKEYPDFLRDAYFSGGNLALSLNHPKIIKITTEDSINTLKQLVSLKKPKIIDNYDEQIAELFLSKNAHLYRAKHNVQLESIKELLTEHYKGNPAWKSGSWVYFPWNNELIHVLSKDEFESLRTIRNKDLITEAEQDKLFNFNVASFGMSVGSAGALALAISGISRKVKLIDGAVISGSNLNRIMTGVRSVGVEKSYVIGRQIYEMNPYSSVEYYNKVNKTNIDSILDKPHSVNLAIDEIDDIEMKVRIRYEARKRRIPVLMATELGDTIMLDVERFDLEPSRELFHGLMPGVEDLLHKDLENYREWTKHAVKIIDPKNMPLKMQHSVLKIGTNIVTHPQLGSTVMMTGGVLAFAVKNIALGNKINSGRYVISLEDTMLAQNKTRRYKKAHKKHTKVIHSSVNSM